MGFLVRVAKEIDKGVHFVMSLNVVGVLNRNPHVGNLGPFKMK